MLNKIQTWLKQKEESVKKEQELKKAKSYYTLIKAGATFIKFIQEDLKRQENEMNRHQRRRFEKELNDKGILSSELVSYYSQKIDWILMNIHQRLNPPKVQPQKKDGVQVRSTPPNGYQPKPSTETGKIIPPQGGTGETKSV
jgi:hypothetical protein